MLQSLHIENVAVVKTLDIEFLHGLTALTGETGAGKSIILDSLNLLLGSRADRELIRSGEQRAEVTALFSELSEEVCRDLEQIKEYLGNSFPKSMQGKMKNIFVSIMGGIRAYAKAYSKLFLVSFFCFFVVIKYLFFFFHNFTIHFYLSNE